MRSPWTAAAFAALLAAAACHVEGGSRSAAAPGTGATAQPGAEAAGAPEVPPAFAGRTNPLGADPPTLERGRAVFLQNCATCHGPEGDGKGIAAAGLAPAPANFHDPDRLPSRGDDYVFWRISTGVPGTAMPAFGATISEADRWAILRYIRSLAPDTPPSATALSRGEPEPAKMRP